jgi:hypothetical protein
MTPAERLSAAAEAGDDAAILALLSDMPEAERADLVPIARPIVAAVKRRGIEATGGILRAALLMAYGLLPVSEIRSLGWRNNHLPPNLEDVLHRRSPERLVPIADYLLDDVTDRAWRVVRPLVREGILPRPDRPSYAIAMLAATRRHAAAALIADDPSLLDIEVWRLFEVEGGGEDSLANHEKFFGDTWGDAFRDLAARSPVMRGRLLDVSLAALARDFATYRAGWFSRFHESLAPTDDERAERTGAYLGLLRSSVGPTVSMAVAALVRIDRAGRLLPEDLLGRIGPVLGDGPAGTAKAALGLIDRAGGGSQDRARRAAVVAADALSHPSADVQATAIALVGRLVDEPDGAVARAVADRLPEVAASQRSTAAGLVARLGGTTTSPPTATVASGAGLPTAPMPTSPVDPARAIEPLSSLEALVDIAVSVIESGEPADDVERVLDAVGRFGADRPDGFDRSTGPLTKRARTILARRDSHPFSGYDPRSDVAALVLAWAAGDVVAPKPIHSSVDTGAAAFLSARVREVAEAAAAGRPFVSLAAPTHAGGWIDPAVLVTRLRSGPPPSTIDLVAAILRLAPDGRDAALASAADLADESGAVVRYALGGDEPIGGRAAWWVAAARVRAPGEDDVAVERRHPGLGPDGGLAARIRFVTAKPDPRSWTSGIKLEVDPRRPGATGVDLPTVLMLEPPLSFFWNGRSDPAMFRWMATIQPGYRETWSAIGALLIARNVDWWSAEWANRAFLEPFLQPFAPIGPHTRTLLGLALGQKEAGERGLATDVVRQAAADGRLDAAALADGLSSTVAIDCDRPNRWALSLADVAAHSHATARVVAEAIGRTLPSLAERHPAKIVPLLRLLDELLAGPGDPPADDARPSLEHLGRASGQAGRLARSILARA